MAKNKPIDFIEIDAKPGIHLFENGSRGSCCGSVDLKDFLTGPNLKKIRTEFSHQDARLYAAQLLKSGESGMIGAVICHTCIEVLEKTKSV